MPGYERECSRDRESGPSHSQSWSDLSRSSVPMWDSSDPDRAPPPLPLNPGTQSPTTRANTSAGIAAAAKLIVEKARESAPISAYTRNSDFTPSTSPERSLIKGAHHRRMQSYQTGNVKDLRSYLDNRSPERSPERPVSTSDVSTLSRRDSRDDLSSFERTASPAPMSRDPLKDTPALRPAMRQAPRPLLGENTPPSATMLALQTMQIPDSILNDVTNAPSTPSPTRPSVSFDFQDQLQNLTTIANNLQREMSQLSRRSKDNATDLISLKEATTQRDEDIRKSLRELTSNFGNSQGLLGPPPQPTPAPRSANTFSNMFESKMFNSPPSASKPFTLPRAASAHSFLEDVRVGSPSPYSVEGAASVAMLEKIIREMVTKEGQERLQSSLSELLEKSLKENTDAAKKVEELSEFIKEKSETRALVPLSNEFPNMNANFESPGLHGKTRSADGKEGRMIGSDDELMKMLQRIKDSVTHSGGTTSEVKGLVRDLRGEVLGMGRELGRRLDRVGETSQNPSTSRSLGAEQDSDGANEMYRIVEEGIRDLKDHLATMMRQRAEESDDTFRQLATRSGPNEEGIFAIVKHALAEHGTGLAKGTEEGDRSDLDREGILEAVKDGLKDFEPNIELQQFGLERDEILAVLKEGLEEYQSTKQEPTTAIVDKGEIYEAMQEALKGFQTPMPYDRIAQLKEEIIDNLRETLAEYQPQSGTRGLDDEATRAAVAEAVREGLATHGPAAPREIEISREDLFDAVKASLDGSSIPFGGFGEQVLQQLRDLIDGMRVEFKQYSTANGRDTEQVLDAVKDGLESLRAEIESYVDRAQDVTGKDEIVDTVKGGLEQLRSDIETYIARGQVNNSGNREMLEYIKEEFVHLHHAIGEHEATRDMDDQRVHHTAEIIMAVKDAMEEMKGTSTVSRSLEDEGPGEEMLEAMKEEFEQLKAAILNAHAHDKSELAETIQDSMGALHAKVNGSELSGLSAGAVEEIIHEMRAEFAHLKETVHSIVVDGDREAIVVGVRQSIDGLRTQLAADQSDAAAEALGAIREELERFKDTVTGDRGLGSEDLRSLDGDTLSTIRSGLEEIREHTARHSGAGVTIEMLEAIRGEFENLRNSIASTMVHANSNDEVLDTVRLGLDDLRSHVDKKLDNPERSETQHNDLFDAINEGLETLRTDVVKILDKPLDMTVNYEILDTLKGGLADLRAEVNLLKTGSAPAPLKGGEIVLAESNAMTEARDFATNAEPTKPAATETHSQDLERLEVLVTQLQIKIEAMDATVHDISAAKPADAATGSVTRDDIVILETLLRELQDNVHHISERSPGASPDDIATKQDTDAIETLLRNTRDRLDEFPTGDLAGGVSKEHFESVETVVRIANDSINAITEKLDNAIASKADVAVVEVMTQDIKSALEELSEKVSSKGPEDSEIMTKADLDVLGIICTEIKEKVSEIATPDGGKPISRADIEQIQLLITEFRESHEKMREGYESDIAVTAKAFDDRKHEFEDTIREIGETKAALAEMKDEMISKMTDNSSGIDTLGETLKGLEEKTGSGLDLSLQELVEKVTLEFERAHGSLDAMKEEHQLATDTSLGKQVEHKEALESLIKEQLETYFDGLMTKYDDAQRAAEEKSKVIDDRALAQVELTASTKAMADDLRLSIDTLGSTLTAFCASFPETVDRMAEDSRTVFDKMSDAVNKLDETHEGVRSEHNVTRGEVARVFAAVDGIQSDLTDHNPRFMVALKELQALIGQHHEHSRGAFDAAADHAQAVKDLQEQVRGLGTQNDDLQNKVIPGLMSLPALTAPEPRPEPEKFDDTALHEKLDTLLNLAREAPDNTAHFDRLDKIHAQVAATASEVSALVSQQSKQISDDHSAKEQEAEALALLIERRQVQKDEVEMDIQVLQQEKTSLQNLVEQLRAEKEEFIAQKSRLTADVSSLETAVHIRREELHDMDRKAETLERRMMEGVLNQSRMLLLSKTSTPRPKKKPTGRDLRVTSDGSTVSAHTVTSSVPPLKTSQALALRSHGLPRHSMPANKAERRIMSLNQINHNRPTGGSAFSNNPSLVSTGLQSLQRSHSVKSGFSRKPSWSARNLGEHDKENSILSEASDEEDVHREADDYDQGDSGSEAGTERRHSYGRQSYGATELSYETGSYMTGSEIDHRMSYGSSALGLQSVIDEEPEEDEEHEHEHEHDQTLEHDHEEEHDGEEDEVFEEAADACEAETAAVHKISYEQLKRAEQDSAKHFRAAPFDSGVGTDLATAQLHSVVGK